MQIQKYPLPMRAFHWTISILVFGMLILGFLMTGWLDKVSYKGELVTWHKSFGVLILCLVVLRLLTRLLHLKSIPPFSSSMPAYEIFLANIVHKLLYVFLLIMPLSGYLMSSLHPKSSGVAFFGISLPQFLPKSQVWSGFFSQIHEISAFALLALITLHVAGVIKHRFFDKPENDSLGRML